MGKTTNKKLRAALRPPSGNSFFETMVYAGC
jgi:hypothetical protein